MFHKPAVFDPLQQQRLSQAYEKERIDGAWLIVQVKAVVLSLVGVWLCFQLPSWSLVLYYGGILSVLLALNGVQAILLVQGRYEAWVPYLITFLEAAVLGVGLLVLSPYWPEVFPPQIVLRWGNFIYYFIIVAGAALSFSPLLVMWAGLSSALVWTVGGLIVILHPDTKTLFGPDAQAIRKSIDLLAFFYHPNFVDVYNWGKEIVMVMLVSGMLAVVVWRSRRLVRNHADTERMRACLARYFSPNLLNELAQGGDMLLGVRRHDAAILFADIVGFTGFSEALSPEEVMAFMREFHSRMEDAVFRFGGTLDKFIGDAVMASFGAPRQGKRDATNALLCARDMQRSIVDWNRRRQSEGVPPLRLGVGVHYGPAVMGDIGSDRTAAFSVVGDTTNTASKLQTLTRHLDVDVVASWEVLEAYRRESPDAREFLEAFEDAGLQVIQGRDKPVHVWTLNVGRRKAAMSSQFSWATRRKGFWVVLPAPGISDHRSEGYSRGVPPGGRPSPPEGRAAGGQ